MEFVYKVYSGAMEWEDKRGAVVIRADEYCADGVYPGYHFVEILYFETDEDGNRRPHTLYPRFRAHTDLIRNLLVMDIIRQVEHVTCGYVNRMGSAIVRLGDIYHGSVLTVEDDTVMVDSDAVRRRLEHPKILPEGT